MIASVNLTPPGMHILTPTSAEQTAAFLHEAAQNRRTICIAGAGSKQSMAGPSVPAQVLISTARLKRIVEYEPNDLTISVEAGHSFHELQQMLAQRGQMVALDPPFQSRATVGGVVACNSSGPMRRAYGTARDLVIGMRFAMLNGRVASAGGMVVKNVAGLDLCKLMIGNFGTLAAITSLNLRLHPLPEQTNTFLYSFPDLESALEKRDAVIHSSLRPMAIDLLSPSAAIRLGTSGFVLAIRAGGSKTVLRRYERELTRCEILAGADDDSWWTQVREFTSDFVRRQPSGVVVRIGTTLSESATLLRSVSGVFVSRAAVGVTYVYLSSWQAVLAVWEKAQTARWTAAVEFAPEEERATRDLWLQRSAGKSDSSFVMMKKIKQMFDPNNLLNRSRLYGQL